MTRPQDPSKKQWVMDKLREKKTKGQPLLYLATPYSHVDDEVVERRVEAVNLVSARLMARGINVFSPITHSHEIQKRSSEVPTTWDFWSQVDKEYLDVSYALVVCCLDGWRESTGVSAEIEHKTPTYYLDPLTLEIYDDPINGFPPQSVIYKWKGSSAFADTKDQEKPPLQKRS